MRWKERDTTCEEDDLKDRDANRPHPQHGSPPKSSTHRRRAKVHLQLFSHLQQIPPKNAISPPHQAGR